MKWSKRNGLLGRAFAVAALSAITALVACGGSTQQEPTARSTAAVKKSKPSAIGGGPVSLVSAVEVIATERCRHESHCDRLGPGRRFVDDQSCQKEFVHEQRTRLDTKVCDTGFVDPAALLECLEGIRMGGCTVETAGACEPSTMCSP
jgi:hypothetical protein